MTSKVRVAMSINAIADQPLEQLKASVKEKGQGADKWAHLSDMLRKIIRHFCPSEILS